MKTVDLSKHPNLEATLFGSPHNYLGDDYSKYYEIAYTSRHMSIDILTEANYRTWQETLGVENISYEVAVIGSTLYLMVPSPTLREHQRMFLEETLEYLVSGYPILDDNAYYEVEQEAIQNAWENADISQRVDAIRQSQKYGFSNISVFAARRDDAPGGLLCETINSDMTI